MLKDRVKEYYLVNDNNCAETMLHVINDEYGLGLQAEDFKLVGAYGAGFGCGITCGALAAPMAALGKMVITGRAHGTEGFGPLCAAYVEAFKAKQTAIDCKSLKELNFVPGDRCLKTVFLACEVFEEFVKEHNLVK